MEAPSPPIRVLVRPPPAPNLPIPPQPPPLTDVSSFSEDGVVVVGFIGKRYHDVAHFINKTIDYHVFGSGKLDRKFLFEHDKLNPEMKKWLDSRNLSFYHDNKQRFVYLQYSSSHFTTHEDGLFETSFGSEDFLEEQEFADLQGLLFMFSVCHVIVYIQEGSRFDMQMLKRFRVLQTGKLKIAPFLRSRHTSQLHSSVNSRTYVAGESPEKPSQAKARVILNRNNSAAVTMLSGLSSQTTLSTGLCIPVILFVFLDDFNETQPIRNMDETSGTTPSSLSISKGSGSIVMLPRPAVNSVGGFKKKLQSSLEAQIRFSIKKCRILSKFENSHVGVRSGAIGFSAPLFTLDASKAVSLVDSFSIQSGESLDFVVGLVDEVLEGKLTLDSLLTGSHLQNTNKEDISAVQEFISRQSSLLRGRGGLSANNSSTCGLGVGMVAVAAAASAASASSGNNVNSPELPTFDKWSSSSLLILQRILSANSDVSSSVESCEAGKEDIASSSSDSYELAVLHMKKCSGINTRLSTWWCEKSYPLAMDIYLNNLPSCYPSSQHEEHLTKALRALSSMVKGPSVSLFMKKLNDDCTSIWTSGRQLCDAISLTGKPCIHQRHDTHDDGGKAHSSGYVYLHACACGRSRQLRPDPFDFENANDTYSVFADCDQLLSSVQIADEEIPTLSWSLIRIGSSKYYKPSKGLLHSGFCLNQKFLQSWTVNLGRIKERDTKVEIIGNPESRSLDSFDSSTIAVDDAFERKLSFPSVSAVNSGGISNFTMRKPFSEVVSGSIASNSSIRILDRKSPLVVSEKSVELQGSQVWSVDKHSKSNPNQASENFAFRDTPMIKNDNGSKFGSANMKPDDQVDSMENATIYIGFEHECPQGHRFILNLDHLKELGSPYWLPEDDAFVSLAENFNETESFKSERNQWQANGKTKKRGKSKSLSISSVLSAGRGIIINQDQRSKIADTEMCIDYFTKTAFNGATLLNRSLPLYMNCPHCRNSSTHNSTSDHKFAGTTSQLQRIFVVTSSYPLVLALAPVIRFELSCLPDSIPNREKKLEFSLPCPVILPPESFVSLKLPFIYGVKLEDENLIPVKPFEDHPQYTAYIVKDTTLQIVSNTNKA